ncbi:MerR family transcriptional regulator [Corynebacterium sp. H128]|uniref:MerR family transcriptional regulator n=1 Tax=Corynebacterium sp. H128 TaxID=3133427 RepID=UPI0030A97262
MKISDVAKASGCSVRAIRNYHAIGILPEPKRTTSNFRDYGVRDLGRIFEIRTLSTAGIPLRRIGTAPLPDLIAEARSLLDAKERAIQEQQQRLNKLASSDLGAPQYLKELLYKEVDSPGFCKHEASMLDLMAFTGVTTARTWELLAQNLTSPSHLSATRALAAVWDSVEPNGPTSEQIEKCLELASNSYTEGISTTLVPGTLPLRLSDLGVSPAHLRLLAAMLP